jgi:hypothetical protein
MCFEKAMQLAQFLHDGDGLLLLDQVGVNNWKD